MGKRAFDAIVSSLLLLLLAPFMAAIALGIWISSGEPILYRSRRVGRHGEPFRMLKFRTMVPNAERFGKTSGESDPRITRVGRILRKTKFDELPQLINVLLGQMSLVGPRPEFYEYARLYTEEEKAILSVRPGITDPASIKFKNLDAILEKRGNRGKYYLETVLPEKNKLRLEYIKNQSVWMDLKIILETAKNLWFG